MRRVLLLAVTLSGVLAAAACKPSLKPGECKSSQDCLKQEGYGKVCVEGRCQECGADADCKEGFVCRGNRCEPKPQCTTDDQCPPGQSCQGERCVAREAGTCASDRDCGPDQKCQNGKCSTREAAAPAVSGECSDPEKFTIHFGFDQSNLTGESQQSLQKLADCLKSSPAKRVVIAGNCDDRGTAQYNIALGNRRADAARKYLSDLGVQAKVETVSYGKEKPVCSEQNEGCWAKNRRDDFQVER
jgi:peptidoglycan-associated lipoprotein